MTVNHYARPGFQAWWLALAISSAIQEEIHWVITSAWTFDSHLRSVLITPLTRWLFSRIARVYGFNNMPPMPPRPEDLEARAKAVLQVIQAARRAPAAWIGMAPEGRDAPGGVLQPPPPGTGRFILQLANLGRGVLPVGVYESAGGLCLSFGQPYRLIVPQGLSSKERDALASQTVMSRIALQIPPGLRGVYARPQDFSRRLTRSQTLKP